MTRQKRKTVAVSLRIEPRIKAAAEQAAERQHRSLTNFIEVLIIEHCKTLNIETDPNTSTE